MADPQIYEKLLNVRIIITKIKHNFFITKKIVSPFIHSYSYFSFGMFCKCVSFLSIFWSFSAYIFK